MAGVEREEVSKMTKERERSQIAAWVGSLMLEQNTRRRGMGCLWRGRGGNAEEVLRAGQRIRRERG